MIQHINGYYSGAEQKLSTFDLTYDDSAASLPVILFCHGFKGFKDWGGFNYVAHHLAENGFAVVKLNFSHNGIGLTQLDEFTDLESFSTNTLLKEMADIQAMELYIKTVLQQEIPSLDSKHLYMIGHSKGGVSAMLHVAHHESSVKKVITWATPFNFHRSFSAKFISDWRLHGVQTIVNGRTKQLMPLSLSVLEDYEARKEFYDLGQALKKIQQPILFIHGSADESVPVENAHELLRFANLGDITIIEQANHTFGMAHPFDASPISPHVEELLTATLNYLRRSV